MRRFVLWAAVALLAISVVPALAQTTGNIVQVADSHASLNTLTSALIAADLTDELSGAGPFTVFAPTDRAFRNLSTTELEALNGDAGALRNLLLYHVVAGTIDPVMPSAASQGGAISLNTVAGRRTVNGSANIVGSIQASNGVIYLIDRVLSVQAPLAAAAPAPAPVVTTGAEARTGLNDQVIVIGAANVYVDPVTHPGQIIAPGLGPTMCQRVHITETLGEYARLGSPYNGWILQSVFVYPQNNPGC